ncbi:MAG: class II fructose-bisphosphate aldolase [Phycisphaeraceae bacterium]
MPLVPFNELMEDAERHGYAVGYFESWNLESLLAVADAAETVRSPVILGFSGLYLPHEGRRVSDPLAVYAAMGAEVGRRLSVPCCLLFNESPRLDWVREAIGLGFQLVMYTPPGGDTAEQARDVREVIEQAHGAGAAVEGEVASLAGLAGDLSQASEELRLTEPRAASDFAERTGVDALAVNIGQAHLHGRRLLRLDLPRLQELRRAVRVPLVLHGASSVDRGDLEAAIALGVRKINVGSALKQAFFAALCAACDVQRQAANPYEVIGSGLQSDVLVAGRLAMQAKVEELMHCFGSAGRAGRTR